MNHSGSLIIYRYFLLISILYTQFIAQNVFAKFSYTLILYVQKLMLFDNNFLNLRLGINKINAVIFTF